MAKVYLEAFGGRLKSAPMDWPDSEIGKDIYLVLDMESPSLQRNERGMNLYELTTKRGRFEFTRSYSGDKELAAIYKLVEVIS